MNLEDYKRAEAKLHVASQMIALSGKNLKTSKTDDSHTTAKWDTKKQLIVGRDFEFNANKYSIFVDPISFALGIQENGVEQSRIALEGLTYIQTVESWKEWLRTVGFQNDLSLKLHYSLPDSDLYKFTAFNKPNDIDLAAWANNRSMANSVLEKLTQTIGTHSEINIWPHHFDSGTYYELHQTNGVMDRSIGAGFNPADQMVSEPYYYIYGWFNEVEIDYADMPVLANGKWEIAQWKGAILPISEVQTEQTVDEFYAQTSNYLKHKLK